MRRDFFDQLPCRLLRKFRIAQDDEARNGERICYVENGKLPHAARYVKFIVFLCQLAHLIVRRKGDT